MKWPHHGHWLSLFDGYLGYFQVFANALLIQPWYTSLSHMQIFPFERNILRNKLFFINMWHLPSSREHACPLWCSVNTYLWSRTLKGIILIYRGIFTNKSVIIIQYYFKGMNCSVIFKVQDFSIIYLLQFQEEDKKCFYRHT